MYIADELSSIFYHDEDQTITTNFKCYIYLLIFSSFFLFAEEGLTAMKALMKQAMVESLADNDNDVERGLLTEQLKHLSFNSWTLLMKRCMTDLIALLHRIRAIHDIMTGVVQMEPNGQDEVLSTYYFQLLVLRFL